MEISVPNPFRPEHEGDALVQLAWQRGVDELQWIDREFHEGFGSEEELRDGTGRVSLRFLAAPFIGGGEQYNPMDEPGIFKVFADLDGSEQGFLGFAKHYGILGLDGPFEGEELGELLSAWVEIWNDVRMISRLIDVVLGERPTRRFEHCFSVSNTSARMHLTPADTGCLRDFTALLADSRLLTADGVWSSLQAKRTDADRVRFLMLVWLQRRINYWLSGKIRQDVGAGVRAIMRPDGKGWRLRMWPRNLASAMFLQAARALEGDLKFRQCKSPLCRKWFVVSSDRKLGRRSDAQYCTSNSKCRKEFMKTRPPGKQGRSIASGRKSKIQEGVRDGRSKAR